jgi:hypothetical protein
MSTYKRCKCILLTTEDNKEVTNLKLVKNPFKKIDNLRLLCPSNYGYDKIEGEYRHLYILSDEKFAIGDWIVNGNISRTNYTIIYIKTQKAADAYNKIADMMNEFNAKIKNVVLTKKIIASTNSNLSTKNNLPIAECDTWTLLPTPSDSFIRIYCDEYSKGNIITNVLVKYNTADDNMDGYVSMFGGHEIGDTVKVTKNGNNIIIKKVRETRTVAEVIKLCQDAMILGVKSQRGNGFDFNEKFLEFLEENEL